MQSQTIDPALLVGQLVQQLRSTNIHETRNYLGMSAIGQCPLKLYRRWFEPDNTDRLIQYGYTGYMHESDLKKRLAKLGVARVVPARESTDARGIYQLGSERELIAPWDSRFQGHTDGETTDGMLLELKSINDKGFQRVQYDGAPKFEHVAQVQTYMHYGEYKNALVVYVNRESFEHTAFVVVYSSILAAAMTQKAEKILKAVDARKPPPCECGYCSGVNVGTAACGTAN